MSTAYYGRCNKCDCPDDIVQPCHHCKERSYCCICAKVCKECKQEFCGDCIIQDRSTAPNNCIGHLPLKRQLFTNSSNNRPANDDNNNYRPNYTSLKSYQAISTTNKKFQ